MRLRLLALVLPSMLHTDTAEQSCVVHGTLLEDETEIEDKLRPTRIVLVNR